MNTASVTALRLVDAALNETNATEAALIARREAEEEAAMRAEQGAFSMSESSVSFSEGGTSIAPRDALPAPPKTEAEGLYGGFADGGLVRLRPDMTKEHADDVGMHHVRVVQSLSLCSIYFMALLTLLASSLRCRPIGRRARLVFLCPRRAAST